MATCFNENDVRPMGPRQWACADKTERGGDYVVGAGSTSTGSALLTITENGYGKRTACTEYGVKGPRRHRP